MNNVAIFLLSGFAAVLACETGYWNDSGKCTKCHPSCESCSSLLSCESCRSCYQRPSAFTTGLCEKTLCPLHCDSCLAGSCSSCDEGYALAGSSCQPIVCGKYCARCKNGPDICTACAELYHWQDENPGTCTDVCPSHCTTCETAKKCLKCDANFLLSEGKCSCTPGTHCLSCSDLTCSRCEEGWKPEENSLNCKCSPGTSCLECTADACSKCEQGWKVVQHSMNCEEVIVCAEFCAQCTAAACTKCVENYDNVEGKCVIHCEDRFYRSNQNKCEECPQQCETCLDANRCIECAFNYFGSEMPGACQACDKSCEGCSSSEKCDKCAVDYFPVNKVPGSCTQECSNTCKECSVSSVKCDVCAPGYYKAVDVPAECQACAKSCEECSNISTCTKCATNYAPSSTPGLCTLTCDSSCETCIDYPTKCQKCAIDFMPKTSTMPGECTNKCDSSCTDCFSNSVKCSSCANSYMPSSNLPGVCVSSCDISCNDCSETARECTTCATNYRSFSKSSKRCVLDTSCHKSCKGCTGTYTTCSECEDGYTKEGDFCMVEQCYTGCSTCIGPGYDECVSCSEGYTLWTEQNICKYTGKCAGACATCYGSSEEQCFTCKAHSSLRVHSTYCVCETNYKLQNSECVYTGVCDATCKTCTGPSSSQCLTCPPNSAQKSGKCACNADYEWHESGCSYIEPCLQTCKTCSGPEKCDSCVENAHIESDLCACDTDYEWSTNVCKYSGACDPPCSECEGPEKCSACVQQLTLSDGKCHCLDDFTWETDKCVYSGPCAEAFATCSGPTKTEGITCDENAQKVDGICSCKELYTWDANIHRCVSFECHSSCIKCSGASSSHCLSCSESSHQVLTSEHTCACADGYYGIVTSAADVCSPCDPTCRACVSSTNCTLCHEHASKVDQFCKCNSGYYWDDSACTPCHPSCTKCSAADICSACALNYVLVETTCVCGDGWLLVESNCVQCHLSCATCDGISSSNCSSCADAQTLTDGACLCNSVTEFNNNGVCTACYDGCASCSGSKSNDCLSCYSGAELTNQKPSACQCLDGKRPAPTPKKCSACPEICVDCLVADPSQCISCIANAEPKSGNFPSSCVCKTGFYFDSNTKVCEKCHMSCRTCNSASPLRCGCNGFSYLNGLFCDQQCLFVTEGNTCLSRPGAILNQPFNSLKAPVDSVQKWISELGGAPFVIFRQGLQLSGAQYIRLPPNSLDSRSLLLPSSFFLDFWVRSSDPRGCLAAKSLGKTLLFSLCVESSLKLRLLLLSSADIAISQSTQPYESDMATEVTLSGGTVTSTWTKIRLSVSTERASDQQYSVKTQLFVRDQLAAEQLFPSSFFRDFSSGELLLGASGHSPLMQGFVGAIAEVLLSVGETSHGSCSCSQCSSSGMCLSSCLSSQYEELNVCKVCAAECAKGCMRGGDCVASRDPLCNNATDFDVCTSCKSLAALKQGSCKCVDNSVQANSACTCIEGYKVSGNDCVACLNYLKSSEVSGSINASCTTIQLDFQRTIQASALRSCSDVFQPDSLSKLGDAPACASRSSTIRVTLGNGFSLRNSDLILNSFSVLATDGPCSFSPEPLTVHVKVPDPPKPVAIIAAPTEFSLTCGAELVLSGANSKAGVQGQLFFKWDIETSKNGALATGYNSFSASNMVISLPAYELSASLLQVTLTVRNSFNSESSAQQSITISDSASLSVSISGGNTAVLMSASSQRFRGRVVGCKTGAVQYVWTSLIASSSNGLSDVLNDQTHGTLTIAEHALLPGNYTFLCTATDSAGASGNAQLQVTVLESPISIVCDKVGGLVSTNQQLEIDCGESFDPDSPDSLLTALWSCESPCKSSSGSDLPLHPDALTLKISERQLTSGQRYVFVLTVARGTKTNSLSLTFDVSSVDGIEVSNNLKPGKRFSNQHAAAVTPEIKAEVEGEVSVSWGDIGSAGLPFLLIPASVLSSGGTLSIQLTLTFGSTKINVKMEVIVNNPPVGGTLMISPASGKALKTVFELLVSGCVEPDDTDYPLSLSFGFGDGNPLGLPTTSFSLTTRLSSSTRSLFVKVCDSGDSCSTLTTSVDVQSSRMLQEDDLVALFKEMSPETDLVPTACTLVAGSASLNSSAWTYIMEAVSDHVAALPPLSENELLAELYCVRALAGQKTAKLDQLLRALGRLNQLFAGPISETLYQKQVETMREYVAANETEVLSALDYYQSIAEKYATTLLPKTDPFLYSSSQLGIFGGRVLASPEVVFKGLEFAVQPPSSFFTEHSLTSSSILNVWVHCWKSSLFPAALMSVSILKSGTFNRLSWTSEVPQALDTKKSLFNVTIPIFDKSKLQGKTGCVCWSGEWTIEKCSVLAMDNSSVLLSTSCLGFFSLVPVEMGILQVDPLTWLPVVTSTQCDRYYAPIGIMVALTGFFLVVGVVFVLIAKSKNPLEGDFKPSDLEIGSHKQLAFSPSQENFNFAYPPSQPPDIILDSDPPQPQQEERIISAGVEDNPKFKPVELESQEQPHSFIEGHFFLASLWRRKPEDLLCLATALLCELFLIGVFYYFFKQGDSEKQPMADFFTDYGGDDVKYFVFAFLLTQILSLILTLLYNPVWTKNANWRRAFNNGGTVISVGACLAFIVLIALMNTQVCYEYAGRWSVGFLWAAIAEVLILEFLIAGVCALLHHYAKQ